MDSETRNRIIRAFLVIDAYAEQADREALRRGRVRALQRRREPQRRAAA